MEIHIVDIDIKSKKNLLKVTDEHTQDNKVLPEFIDDIIKPMREVTVVKLFADGTYFSNYIFKYLSDSGILPCIKVRNNAKVQLKKDTSIETYQF